MTEKKESYLPKWCDQFWFYVPALLILIWSMIAGCQQPSGQASPAKAVVADTLLEKEPEPEKRFEPFERTSASKRLRQKIIEGQPLVVHLHVALCDNEHQGIVPVPKSLGDGQNANTNLYWGAKYGVRNFFKKYTNWQLINTQQQINENVLERLIFFREYPNNTKAYLIADAYRGDRMSNCLTDFFEAMAGKRNDEIALSGKNIGMGSRADLLLFNGHNGLMDMDVDFVENTDSTIRDVAVIGCVSHFYFKDHLLRAKGYPLLMTTNLMAPEAYVVDALIDAWAAQKEGDEIRKAAGLAYHKYQQCGVKGATNLFRTGWRD